MKQYVVECREWWPNWVIKWKSLPNQPDWFISWIDEHWIFKYYFEQNPKSKSTSWDIIKKWLWEKWFYIREKYW